MVLWFGRLAEARKRKQYEAYEDVEEPTPQEEAPAPARVKLRRSFPRPQNASFKSLEDRDFFVEKRASAAKSQGNWSVPGSYEFSLLDWNLHVTLDASSWKKPIQSEYGDGGAGAGPSKPSVTAKPKPQPPSSWGLENETKLVSLFTGNDASRLAFAILENIDATWVGADTGVKWLLGSQSSLPSETRHFINDLCSYVRGPRFKGVATSIMVQLMEAFGTIFHGDELTYSDGRIVIRLPLLPDTDGVLTLRAAKSLDEYALPMPYGSARVSSP